MPLPYGQVKDLYDQLKDAGVVTQSMPDWSAHMQDLTGSDQYSEGLHDNVIRRASHGLDKLIEATGIPDVTGAFGRAVGNVFDKGDVGEAAGRAIPRGLVDFAPLALSAIPPLAPVGVGLSALLSGAHTYADTGSVAAGVASGAVAGLLPGVTEAASQAVLGRLGARYLGEATSDAAGNIIPALNKYLPGSVGLGSRALAEAAGQGAAALTMGAGDVARQALDPNEEVTNPFTGDFALGLGLQTLPFSALHAATHLIGEHTPYEPAKLDANIAATRKILADQAQARELEKAAPITANPSYNPTSFADEEQAKLTEAADRLAQVTTRSQKISTLMQEVKPPTDPAAPPPDPAVVAEKKDELAATQEEQLAATGGVGTLDGLPMAQDENTTHVAVVADKHEVLGTKKSRKFTVADVPENEGTGLTPGEQYNYSIVNKQNGVTIPYEPKGPPVQRPDGKWVIQVPVNHFQPFADKVEETQKATAAAQPTLPEQPKETDPTASIQATQKVVQAMSTMSQAMLEGNPEKIHQSKQLFNSAKVDVGEDPWDDARFASHHEALNRDVELAAVAKAQAGAAALAGLEGRIAQRTALAAKAKQDEADRQARMIATQERVTSGDPEKMTELDTYLKDRASTFKEGRRPDVFWDVVDKWDKSGQKGGTARLDDLLEEMGRKNVKEKAPVIPVVEASKEDLAATMHAKDFVGNVAFVVLDRHAPDLTEEEIDSGHQWASHLLEGEPIPKELASQEHIMNMQDELTEMLKRASVKAPPRPPGEPTSAGDKWVWGLTDFDPKTDALGGKPLKALGAADGVMPVARFKNLAGRGKPLNDTEIELGRKLVPQAFKEGETLPEPEMHKFNPVKLPNGNVKFIAFHGSESKLKEIDDKAMFVSSQKDGSGYGKPTKLSIEGKFLSADDYEKFAKDHGIDPEDLFHDEAGSEEAFINEVRKAGYDGVFHYDQRKDDGDVMPAAIVVNPKAIQRPSEGPTVDVRKLFSGLKEQGPVMNTLTYGQDGKPSAAKAELDQMTHEWADTLPRYIQQEVVAGTSGKDIAKTLGDDDPWQAKVQAPEFEEQAKKYRELKDKVSAEPPDTSPRATHYYDTISPYDTKKFPVTRVDVALPESRSSILNKKATREGLTPEEKIEASKLPDNSPDNILWRPDGTHENVPNTLGWAMVQFVPDPKTGETVAFVGEQQSRWGQHNDKTIKNLKEWNKTPEDLARAKKETHIQEHPLLDQQHVLVLKAVIAHIRELNVEREAKGLEPIRKLVTSDGETAMMTEGHDKQNLIEESPNGDGRYALTNPQTNKIEYFNNKQDAQARAIELKIEPSQSGGMRLHYDTTLTSTTKKLTGDGGIPWEGGVHKNALEAASNVETFATRQEAEQRAASDQVVLENSAGGFEVHNQKGSPVFRNADGTPKTSITGRAYDLTDAFARQQAQGGATLGDPTRAIRPYKPQGPEEVESISRLRIGQGGHEIMAGLASRPFFSGLAKDLLARFPQGLKRIFSSLTDDDKVSAVWRGPNNTAIMQLTRGLLAMSPEYQDSEVMHEMLHGLTRQAYADPRNAPLVAKLNDLRQRLVQALPKSERAIYDGLVESNWYDRYAAGDVTTGIDDLGGDVKTAMKLYGLLDGEELITQGFTSSDMRRFMQSVKGERTNGWMRFTGFVKDILGIGEKFQGTAFDEFMGHTSRLMESGEQVSTASNFLEGWFKSRGAGTLEAQHQGTRALGILMSSGWDKTHDGMLNALEATQPIPSARLARAANALTEMIQSRGEDFATTSDILSELGHVPTRQGINDFVSAALRDELPKDKIADALMLMPAATKDYVFAKLGDYREVMGGVKASVSRANDRLLNIADPEEVRGPAGTVLAVINSVLTAEEQHKASVAMVQDMTKIMPDVFAQAAMAPPRPNTALTQLLSADDASLTTFQKWFSLVGRIARSNPITAEHINNGFSLIPSARQMQGNIAKVMGLDIRNPAGGLSEDSLHQSVKALQNTRVAKIVHQWIGLNQIVANKEKAPGVTMLPESHPEVAKLKAGLSPSEWQDVHDIVTKSVAMTQVGYQEIQNKVQQIGITRAAKIVVADGNMKPQDGIRFATQLWRAVTSPNPQDPAVAASIAAVQSHMTPDGWLELVKLTQVNKAIFDKYKELHDANPAYVSAQRQQKLLVHYSVGGKTMLGQADSEYQAKELVKQFGGRFIRTEQNFKGSGEDFPVLGPDAGGVVQEIARLEDSRLDMMQQGKNPLSPEQLAEYKRLSVSTQFAREAANTGPGIPASLTPPRLLSKGAENLPWLRNQFSQASKLSNYWTRQLFRAQADLHLNSPEMLQQDGLRTQLQTWSDALLRNDPQLITKVNRLTSTWFMGYAPATAMVNGLQTLSTLAPELTRMNGGKVLDSYRRWANAIGEVTTSRNNKWKTPERAQFIKDVTKMAEVDYSQYDPDQIANEAISTRYLQVMDGNVPQSVGQRLGNKAGALSSSAYLFFRPVEKFNHLVTLISAFDLARDQGQTYEQAKQTAVEVNRAVNYGGGRAQRPIAPFSGKDPFSRSVAMLGMNMQNYNLGVIGQLGQYIREGFFRPAGLKPAEIHAARKAALQMVGTQLAAAGVLGLPFVAGGLAVLNQLFPGAELGRHLRESMSQFLDDDKDHNGSGWSDIALTGLPSMLGWDMQSRLSMGNLVPGLNENNGFQPEALLGPPYSLLSNFVSGAARLSSGDARGAEAFLPPAVKKTFQLAMNDGVVKNYKGDPLFNPTVGEKIGIGLGFNPKRASDANAVERMLSQAQKLGNQREGQFRQEQANDVVKGNFGSVRQALLARLSEDKTYDVRSAASGIAQAAEDFSFPRDLREQGNLATSPTRQQLLRSFGITSAGPSEVQRLAFRQGVLQKLGVPMTPDLAAQRTAVLTDQLRATSPTLTRAQLRLQARKMTSGSRSEPSLSESQ